MRFLIALALLIPTAAFAQQPPSPELQAAVMQVHAAAEREIIATAEVIRLRGEIAKLQAKPEPAPAAEPKAP